MLLVLLIIFVFAPVLDPVFVLSLLIFCHSFLPLPLPQLQYLLNLSPIFSFLNQQMRNCHSIVIDLY